MKMAVTQISLVSFCALPMRTSVFADVRSVAVIVFSVMTAFLSRRYR